MPDETKQAVVVTDIRMPFFSMVIFMVKWAIAAIPAFLILTAISFVTWGVLSGLLPSWTSAPRAVSIHDTGIEALHSVSASELLDEPTGTARLLRVTF